MFKSKDQQCTVDLHATEQNLRINLTDKKDPTKACQSLFKSTYLEEIARKTGHAKTYPQLVQMLIAAFNGDDLADKVFIDLMGINDLQLLKSKKGQRPDLKTVEDPLKPQKRYLILT